MDANTRIADIGQFKDMFVSGDHYKTTHPIYCMPSTPWIHRYTQYVTPFHSYLLNPLLDTPEKREAPSDKRLRHLDSLAVTFRTRDAFPMISRSVQTICEEEEEEEEVMKMMP